MLSGGMRSGKRADVKSKETFADLINRVGIGDVSHIREKREAEANERQRPAVKRRRRPLTLDLHGLRSDEAKGRLIDFVTTCERGRVRKAIIVTGMGHGVLKKLTMEYLEELVTQKRVSSFRTAIPKEGGLGALEVIFK